MYRFVLAFALVIVGHGQQPFQLEEKIVGGKNTTIEEYPYQLSLIQNGKHNCGAVLIKTDIALTAGHCVENVTPSALSTRAGSSFRETGGIVLKVKVICSHPKYKPDFSDYDVAVLQLEKPYVLSASIKTIPLRAKDAEVAAGTMGTATGWGQLSFDGPLADVLQTVQVPKIDNPNCIKYYPEEDITPRMACYGYKEGMKDVCYGDSGGPVVVNGTVSGLASWGYGCAFPDRPNVYTQISNPDINDFISKFINNPSSFVNC